MTTSQQKTFSVLEFAKTNAIVTVQHAVRTDFGINPPIERAFDDGFELDSSKKMDACAKERVLEDHAFHRSKQRRFTMRLKGAHVSLHFEQVVNSLQRRVLQRRLHIKPCKLSLVQALTNDDKVM